MPTSSEPLKTPPSFSYPLTLIVTALLALSSTAGLVYGRGGLYGGRAALLPALLAQDAIALLLGVPLLLVSVWRARRGSVRGLLCWMGLLFYIAYFWYFYVVGIKFGPLFVIHIGLVSMSLFGTLQLLFSADLEQIKKQFDPNAPVKLIGGFLMTTAVMFAALWLVVMAWTLARAKELDATTRSVIAIDGVVLLPLSFFSGLWIWRREALGYVIASVMLVKVVSTFVTLIATTVVSAWWGVAPDVLQTAMYAAGLIAGIWVLFLCMRSIKPITEARYDTTSIAHARHYWFVGARSRRIG